MVSRYLQRALSVLGALGTFSSAAWAGPMTDSTDAKGYFEQLDASALEALDSLHITSHSRTGGPFSFVHVLYLLPSGRLAFPVTAELTERDKIAFSIMKPPSMVVTFEVLSCGDPVDDRIHQSGGKEKAQSTINIAAAKPAWQLVPLPYAVRCSGSFKFRVVTTEREAKAERVSQTETTLAPQSVYLYTISGGYGYDSGRPERWSLLDRPAASGTNTERYLVRSRDETGPGAFVSVGLRPCGFNPKSVRTALGASVTSNSTSAIGSALLCFALSPTLVIPTNRIGDAFGVAFPIASAFGTEILLGASITPNEKLQQNINGALTDTSKAIGEGRAYTLPGKPPTITEWKDRSIGWFIGVSASIEALKNAFNRTKQTSSTSSSTQSTQTVSQRELIRLKSLADR